MHLPIRSGNPYSTIIAIFCVRFFPYLAISGASIRQMQSMLLRTIKVIIRSVRGAHDDYVALAAVCSIHNGVPCPGPGFLLSTRTPLRCYRQLIDGLDVAGRRVMFVLKLADCSKNGRSEARKQKPFASLVECLLKVLSNGNSNFFLVLWAKTKK